MATLVLGLAASGALIAAAVAGCGGRSAGDTPGGAANSAGGTGLEAYLSCLNQHGVHITVPSGRPTGFPSRSRSSQRPTVRPTARRSGGFGGNGFGGNGFGGGLFGDTPPSGVDQATWQAAQQACAQVRPSFGAPRDNGAIAAYLNCLHDHGLSASARPNQLNTADPAVAAAMAACAPLRPTAPAPSATG